MNHYKYRHFFKVKMPALDIKQLIGIGIISLLILGIGAGAYLVQRQQTLKSRATTPPGDFVRAFDLKDANGNQILCDNSKNPPECTTRTLDINVRVGTTAPLVP